MSTNVGHPEVLPNSKNALTHSTVRAFYFLYFRIGGLMIEDCEGAIIFAATIFILAVWKVVDILLWAMSHIRISIV